MIAGRRMMRKERKAERVSKNQETKGGKSKGEN